MAPFTKKRKLVDRPVEELKFDNSARDEYLTGFSKRKTARKEAAKQAAIKREKEEKVRERKQLREQRKEDLESHVAAVNDELRKQNAILNGEGEDDDEFEGFGESSTTATESAPAAIPTEEEQLPDDAEYIDEDKYTTVTVEAMGGEEEEEVDKEAEKAKYAAEEEADKKPQKKRPWDDKSKVKKKKFRYESKAERAVTRKKQHSQNKKFAKARREG